jgi:hypothetical protein
MTTQKKSLLSKLKTTKKAIVASNSTEEKPNVSATVSARFVAKKYTPALGRFTLRVRGPQ